jgi:hypothetical protein
MWTKVGTPQTGLGVPEIETPRRGLSTRPTQPVHIHLHEFRLLPFAVSGYSIQVRVLRFRVALHGSCLHSHLHLLRVLANGCSAGQHSHSRVAPRVCNGRRVAAVGRWPVTAHALASPTRSCFRSLSLHYCSAPRQPATTQQPPTTNRPHSQHSERHGMYGMCSLSGSSLSPKDPKDQSLCAVLPARRENLIFDLHLCRLQRISADACRYQSDLLGT